MENAKLIQFVLEKFNVKKVSTLVEKMKKQESWRQKINAIAYLESEDKSIRLVLSSNVNAHGGVKNGGGPGLYCHVRIVGTTKSIKIA